MSSTAESVRPRIPVLSSRRIRLLAVLLAECTAALGVLVLVGWTVGSERLIRLHPSLVAMQPATATDFVLLGTATALLVVRARSSRAAVAAALVLAAGVVVLAATGLVTEITDEPYPFSWLADMTQNDGRMSGITAIGHLVVAAGIAALALGRRLAAHVLALVGLVIGLIGLSGYAYGTSDLYGVGYFQTLALHTAAGIAVVGAALLLAAGDVGVTRIARSSTPGGRLVRSLLPVVVLLPSLLGWISLWWARSSSLGIGFVLALVATAMSLVGGAAVLLVAARLQQAEVSREEAVAARAETDRAMTDLGRATRQLEVTNRDLREFNAAAAHDLRGPLSAIQLAVQLLERDATPARVQLLLPRLRNATDRGLALVQDLLDYASVGTVETRPATLDLGRLVSTVAGEVSIEHDRPLDLRLGPLVPVQADPALIRRLLANLVSNAVKYTPGDGPVSLLVRAEPRGRQVLVSVADRGLAIEGADRTRLFEIFQRGDEAAEHAEGTGLGLAICRRVVERHGGTIEVAEEPGWSKRFAFTLPAVT
ncbi:sensor histidine kinase [Nocardioides acrostichi]|uniref:Sensor-like histidine kinase SenX3 n=1 Tax=Nocardioides acrostichi TaxID=2784339 RepID=A0A930UXU8_9ACTN|nr:HAMP domain-containing sensor histidine kinase [Nocardioides acrostichi]MBF4161050.1 HAMP domain-containing histidine kinase [Nocardioides acrostichi]